MTHWILSLGIAAALLATTTACTTATPYQTYRPHSAGGVHGGYSEKRLASDRYLVRFHGNSLTSRERVEHYMLYRAAELTVQDGYDWFMAVDRNMEHTVRTIVEPSLSSHIYGPNYPFWQPEWRYYVHGSGWSYWRRDSDRFDVRRIESFEASANIAMRKGTAPISEPRAIDARRVLSDFGNTIERPKS